MNFEDIRRYCTKLEYVSEEFPFDEKTMVFKVMGKMFALIGIDELEPRVNLKCDPEYAIELRERYLAVSPGYHQNKKHWNSVLLNSDMEQNKIYELVEDSYNLVLSKIPKSVKQKFENN